MRLAAFDCLLLGYSPTGKAELATYYFTVAARDSSRLVRRHVARGLCEALVFLLSTGQIRIPPEKAEQLVDGTGPVAGQPHKPKDDETDSHVRALRKEIGRSAVMREGVMTVVTCVHAAPSPLALCLPTETDLALLARLQLARGRL